VRALRGVSRGACSGLWAGTAQHKHTHTPTNQPTGAVRRWATGIAGGGDGSERACLLAGAALASDRKPRRADADGERREMTETDGERDMAST
jgi:hypothetical protein